MTPLSGITIGLLLAALGFVSWRLLTIRRQRKYLDYADDTVVYQDLMDFKIEPLVSTRLGLKGRPDRIIEQDGMRIPVEFKTGKTPPKSPYASQAMQVIAYCALVEEHYGVRPPYGIIRYTDSGKEFPIDYTPESEQELVNVLALMRTRRMEAEVHRSHENPRVCRACSHWKVCNERIVQ